MAVGAITALLALMLGAAMVGAGGSSRLHLPRIVGYIIGGLALKLALVGLRGVGMSGAGQLLGANPRALDFIRDLALTAVLFSIGTAFESHHLRRLGRSFLLVALGQTVGALILTFAACAAVGYALGIERPLLMASFAAVVAVAVSPAATLLTIRQYEAKGPTTDDVLAVTGLSALVAIFLFDILLLVTGEAGLVPVPGAEAGKAVMVLRIGAATGGSLMVGVLAGLALSLLHGRMNVGQEMLALLGMLLGVLALSERLGLDYRLASLMAGVTFINVAHDPGRLEQRLAVVIAPLLALLFVLAGFNLHLEAFASAGAVAVVLAYVAGRAGGKVLGVRLSLRGRGGGAEITPGIGLGLLCQADIAVGLILGLERLWSVGGQPAWVSQLAAGVLGAVPIFECAGPLLLRRTVVAAGEVRAFRLFHFPAPAGGGWGRIKEAVALLFRRLGILPLPQPHEGPILARHVMHTNVKLLPAGAELDEVLRFIERSRLDHFPVVDGQGRFVGTISLADVRDIIYRPELRALVTAQDLLEDDLVTASPDETLEELFEKFRAHKARDLIVLDAQTGTVLGIVEQRDVLRAMHMEQTAQKPEPEH